MTDGPQAKRAKSDPDLKVVTDDGEVMVHSLILMLASPVFEKMLCSSMQEGSGREIRLPGKNERELSMFYKSLQLHTMVPLTKDSAIFLSRWADEYQVDALKNKCEDFLLSSVPVDGSSLKHAVTYGMHKRAKQCIQTMLQDAAKYVDDLRVLAEDGAKEHLQAVWPALCSSAGIGRFPMPQPYEVRVMWPFLAAAVRSHKHVGAASAYDRLCADAKTWPLEAYRTLPVTGKADERSRDFITEKLKKHGIQPASEMGLMPPSSDLVIVHRLGR